MEFLVRFGQLHESFRVPELQALAVAEDAPFDVVSYDPEKPFCVIRARDAQAAVRLVHRSILTQSVYEYWGGGGSLDELHQSVKAKSSHLWERYSKGSWKFSIDSFQGSRTADERRDMINTFRYMPLHGPIRMKDPDHDYTIFEEWPIDPTRMSTPPPTRYHFGRFLGKGGRDLVKKYDLKKRPYISTTSMDSELALVTANMALAGPGKIFYDPFVGTGSFPIACSAFGAISWGSDIDGRAVRGSGHDSRAEAKRSLVKGEKTLRGNFKNYELLGRLGDIFTSDLTNTPLRRLPFGRGGPGGRARLFDGIVCDPPYGVREGLRVLGCRDPESTPWVVEAGYTKYKDPDFIAPKKPYSFLAMLDDILQFSAETLVDGGRLSFWMPTANDQDQEIGVPTHPCLEIITICVQPFNKWSRRLITYRKLPDESVSLTDLEAWEVRAGAQHAGVTAEELNPFRKGYFNKFQKETPP
ncbi:tRNA guanosine-2'-O-methyltransferase [Cryphonectria parasitica EP155]|uniref:tRNA (guanine(10)-N(2))-methyltransferase n=1 Tax=Cryphonectria parasitica (strain ATCC 38755 / EP155) TaxID=660469 RepID=A0A9P4Y5J5_CRYP1|nr:tRNA guanosine-2'-O-methyltransferase [Cryphonectria parasitica EP155]KAF3766752.1 tRNA guanosine-2'-O-methyltransferase [Cryphonectria parasitica EP155]